MSDFATEWGATYNKANIAFSKDINTGYNGDRTRGAMLKRLLADALNTAAVANALAALDKIDLGSGSAKQKAAQPANIKTYKAVLAKFESEKTKSVKEFEDASKLKVTVKDKNGYELPTEMKTAFPDTYRQLKILQTEIKAIAARAANALAGALTAEKQDKIEAEKNKAKSKVTGADDAANAKLAVIANEAAMKTFLLKFGPSFKSSMAKGAAAIQKIKANPDLATYNKEMNDAGRDISQNLVNIAKLQADAKFKSTKLAKALPKPGPLVASITPFANGARRNLPPTATAADIKAALADFTALYKKIAAAYADVITGKLK
jgi:hypothetical protein